MEIITEVRKLIRRNKINDAFTMLLDFFEEADENLYNEVLTLNSKWEQISEEYRTGSMDVEEFSKAQTRITRGLTKIVSASKNTASSHGNGTIVIQGASNSGINIGSGTVKKTRILFLASNPADTGQLQLAEEYRRVSERLQDGGQMDNFELYQKWAVTTNKLVNAILSYKPRIIHFSGHGKGEPSDAAGSRNIGSVETVSPAKKAESGIILQDQFGKSKIVETKALANMFRIFRDDPEIKIKAVVLNACYSKNQAVEICKYVPYVVGMDKAVRDESAVIFTTGFYRGIALGKSIELSFELGRNLLELEGMDDARIVQLHKE